MKAYLPGITSSAPSTTAVNYDSILSTGTGSWSTTEATRAMVVPHAMTLDRLWVTVTTAPGIAASGKKYDFEIMKNGSASGLKVTIFETGTSALDLAHTLSLAAGDTISLRSTPTSTPASTGTMFWHVRQTATSQWALMGQNVGMPTSGTNFQTPQGRALIASTDALGGQIAPCAGTISNLYLQARAAPGAGRSWAYTLMLNGVATSLTATISGTGTTANDTTHSVSIAAGDLISWQIVTTGTPTSTTVSHAVTFAPTTDGDSFLAYQANGSSPSTSATQYQQPLGDGVGSWNATETNRILRIGRCTIKGLFAQTSVSPGVSPKAYTFTVRKELADTSAAVTINDASTTVGSTRTGNITGQTITVDHNNRLALKSVPASTPVAVFAKLSILINTPDNALLETFQDDANDNSLDATKWESGTNGAGSTFSESSQQWNETPAASVAGAESYMPALGFNPIYNLVGSYGHTQLKQALNGDANDYTMFHLLADDLNELYFQVEQNPRVLVAYKVVGGTQTSIASATYDPVAHQWLRIRESGGTIYFDVSTDGTPGNWVNFTNLAAPFQVTDVYPKMNAFADNVASPGAAIWDNFNIIPAYNSLASIQQSKGRRILQAINRSNVF